jgi:hypothetical protein
MAELHQKKMKLEALVNDFQDNNEEYLKVIKTVGEEVLSVLPNVQVLLRCALLSTTESIRNNPERYRLIFYNMSSQEDPSKDYGNEANASMIVDEAEKLFNKLVKDCMNKVIIIDYPFSKSSSLSLPLLPPSDEGQRNHRSPTVTTNQNIHGDNEDKNTSTK